MPKCQGCKKKITFPHPRRPSWDEGCFERRLEVGTRWENKYKFRIVEITEVTGKRVRIKTLVSNLKSRYETHTAIDRFVKTFDRLHGRCHQCQLKLGAEVPKGGLVGVTVTTGVCAHCLKLNASLVPDCDYNWPKKGRRAIFD